MIPLGLCELVSPLIGAFIPSFSGLINPHMHYELEGPLSSQMVDPGPSSPCESCLESLFLGAT